MPIIGAGETSESAQSLIPLLIVFCSGIFGFGFISALCAEHHLFDSVAIAEWFIHRRLSVYLYIVDAFAFPASAISAVAVLQSLLGFAFPLFGQEMYSKLGYGGGNSLLAGLAIVIGIPFPVWIWYKGANIRKRSAAFLSPDEHLSP